MTRTFEAPRTYRPSASILGRAIRAWTNDRLQGEALYLVMITSLTLVLLLVHYLSWALLNPVLTAHPAWKTIFWGAQAVSILALVGLGLVGFRPAVRVTCSPDAVRIQQGNRTCTLTPSDIEDVALISARRYHRHYRRYAATHVFISTIPEQMLCVRTHDGPVVVAIPDPDAQAALLDHLETLTFSPAPETGSPP